MKYKRFAILAVLALFGLYATFQIASQYRDPSPMIGFLSDNLMVFKQESPVSFLGLDLSAVTEPKTAIPEDSYLQNVCINGKNPSKLSTKEQLLEFVQGPCQPVVLIPGLLGSRLSVKVDCEKLKENNPAIFQTCGWETCSSFKFWDNKPEKEYTLWISDFTGPMSLAVNKSVGCWGEMIQIQYDPKGNDLTQKYKSPVGVEVTVYEKSGYNELGCGFEAVGNLMGNKSLLVASAKGYTDMKNALVNMGYQIGLSLYAAPYDWRKTTVANKIGLALNNTLKQIYDLTGKPSILIGHSLGNFGALYLLNSLSQSEKDKYVANYVSVMNPLAGAPKSALAYVGGDSSYFIANKFGLNFAAEQKLFQGSSGALDVLPKDPFNYFKGQTWLEEWRTRVHLEDTYDVKTASGKTAWKEIVNNGSYPFKWFPSPLEQCFKGFSLRTNECALQMYDWSKEAVVQIKDKVYTGTEADMKKLFNEQVTVTKIADHLFADINTNGIYKLENPRVPTTIVYGSHLNTVKSFYFDYDPKTKTQNGQYAPPTKTTYAAGDGTVPSTSALLSAFKWSWEFDNGLPNAKPVKTVEICSMNNNRGTVYDKQDKNSPYQVLKNEYIGVPCDCSPLVPGISGKGAECSHSAIISDKGLIKFIKNLVNANAPNSNYTNTKAYTWTNAQLSELSLKCPTVRNGAQAYFDLIKTDKKVQQVSM